MKNVSDKLKNIIEKGGLFYAYAKVLFADGTKITLDSEDDFSISDNGYSESGGDDLPLGSALSKTITLSLFNEDGRFSDYDFFYSQITLYTEADLEDGTQERINEGVFYVTSPVATGEVIEITAYDAMYKANKEFTSKLSYPATARNLLLEVCAFVGITVADAHFKNEDFQIQSMPEKTTARKIIGYIAQISVGNAIIKNGSLSIKSYDFEPLKDVTDGTLYTELPTQSAKYHVLSEYSDYPTVGMNPVTITGIRTTKRVNNEDVEYLNGTDDYALTITNPLITGAEEKALELIGDVLNGMTLTSFSGTFFPYPTAEIMDCAVIVDQNDKVYKTVITTHDFSYPGESELSCGIKDPETNSSTYYSESAEMYHKAQAEANKNRKEMESAIENLQTTLANAKGMYTSKVRQADGSYITYLHDKPTMSESENVIKITSDAVGVSTDGGQTYPYGFFLTGDLVAKVLYAIGINADYINTGALTIRDKDGNITFYADTETGRVDIRAESLSIGGQTLEAIANIAVKNFVDNVYTKDINNLKDQVTNKIETWYQPTDPAVDWGGITEIPWCDVDGNAILDTDGNEMYLYLEETKASHIGDLWKNTTTNEEYRYSESGEWVKMPVPDAVFDEIDGKAQIFINTPSTPYSAGDLWFDSSTSDIMTCVKSRETGDFTSSDWEKRNKYTDNTAVENFIKYTYAEDVEKIKEQLDQKIETWYQDEDPALSWTAVETTAWCDVNGNKILDVNGNEILIVVESEKVMHEGDLWHTKTGNKEYIYQSGHWVESSIPDEVFDKIDGKASIYVAQPKPPYDVGDTWFTGTDIKVCTTARASGNFDASDWGKKDNYTDDSTVNDFIQNTYNPKIEDIQTQIDGKIDTYFYDYEPTLSNVPASAWTTEELKTMHNGDLFFWKTKGYTYRFLKIDSVWQWFRIKDSQIDKAMKDASNAQDTADSKRRVFVTTPVPPYDVGDLWAQGKSGDLMRCKVAKASGTFITTDWEKAVKYTDDSAVDDLDKALTQEDIFNRLTNNGQVQGLFLKDGKIYLNFSYAEGGTLKLGGANNGQGTVEVYSRYGTKFMSINNEGLTTYAGKSITSYIDAEDYYGKFKAYTSLQGGITVSTDRNKPTIMIDPFYIKMWDETGTQLAYFDVGYDWWIRKNLSITGDFSVTGKKSRAVNTKSYSRRLLNAYETPAPMFGDVGEGTIGVDGKCYISIDPIFLETIASGCKYQVFLQKNGKGDVWVSERHETYFVVEGTESLSFSWELKARQKDYEYDRIEVYNENVEERDIDYAYIGEMEYQNYVDTMQAEV